MTSAFLRNLARKAIPKSELTLDSALRATVRECREPLVQTNRLVRHDPVYWRMGYPGTEAACWLRRSVAEKLVDANCLLRPEFELVTLDGWRSEECQQAVYAAFVGERKAASRLESPEAEEVFVCRPVWSRKRPPLHSTGASVDVTLARNGGPRVDMGAAFDEFSARAATATLEDSEPSSVAAANRRLLFWALRAVGFTNLPVEYWHYDWQGQLWAVESGEPSPYGLVDEPGAFADAGP